MDTRILNIIGKEWRHPSGQVRYYLSDWERICDMDVISYGKGKDRRIISAFDCNLERRNHDKGGEITELFRNELIDTKIWLDTDADIHVDRCNNAHFREEFKIRTKMWLDKVIALNEYIRSNDREFQIRYRDYTGDNWYADSVPVQITSFKGSRKDAHERYSQMRDDGLSDLVLVPVYPPYVFTAKDYHGDELESLYKEECKE